MRWEGIVDVEELKKAINVLKPEHQLFEIRVFGADKRGALSGYFTDCDMLITALDTIDLRNKNLYITLNKVNAALYSRSQHDKFIANTGTTSDPEIEQYEWLFIDLDPIRPTNISSSEDELEYARTLKTEVRKYLSEKGFAEPVEAMSGNGYHLLYRVNLSCSDENKQLMNDCLVALSSIFNNQTVKIDTVNYNPARICKLYGTLAQKGYNTKERPHRMSKLLSVPDPIITNDKSLLQALAAEIPQEAPKYNDKTVRTIKQEFNIRDWLALHNITYREDVGKDCQMFLLDECPFDSSHKNGDSKIFAYTNGAIAFKCHHNSCRNYKWQDVRRKFEPEAYENKPDDERLEAGYQRHKQIIKEPDMLVPLDGDQTDKPKAKPRKIRKLKTAKALMKKDLPDPKVFVGIGEELPFLVEGTCILSAKPKLGKSWLALSLCLAVANGEDFIGYKTNQCSVLYLDLETSETIQKKRLQKALKDKPVPNNFYLETETNTIGNGFVEQIEAYLEEDPRIGIVVIDVFQIIRTPVKGVKESDYEHAYRDITPLNDLAQKHHISIILVCHDRKAVDPDDPFSNILGSTGLQGAATQMIVMFRKKKEDPIHISIKGKTIDGLPELNVQLDNAEWSIVEGVNTADREIAEALREYHNSTIREAVIEVMKRNTMWKGRCSEFIRYALECDIPILEGAKYVGGFFHRHQVHFRTEDSIKITFINNGTGPNIYKIERFTIDTIDESSPVPLIDFEEVNDYKVVEDIFPIKSHYH